MGEPILLLIWIPISRILHSGHLMLTDFNCDGLFSTLRRGKIYFYKLTSSVAPPRVGMKEGK